MDNFQKRTTLRKEKEIHVEKGCYYFLFKLCIYLFVVIPRVT